MSCENQKRHKCHYCGAVRYEGRMMRLHSRETNAVSQFGNDNKCWACRRWCYNKEVLNKRPENLMYKNYIKK